MRQILQNLGSGETRIEEVPCPAPSAGHLLVATERTLISAGTERMIVDFAKANILDKARQQPEKMRMVLDKVRADGLMPTLEAVRSKLEQPLALGYCNVGCVIGIGGGVSGFSLGDRVASNGPHAEVVSVPINLSARVPDEVSSDEAAFTVVGAIALQGIRLVQPTLGEAVVVTGLGLIGQLTVQLLRAHGCRVLGIDLDRDKLAMAEAFGAETVDLSNGADPVGDANRFSRGRGVDAVIITASTRSNEPVHQAALMCRKRGRIVLVGVAGLELSRADFYEKELTFQVSCSYGPGRYDPNYEQKGQDYPVGFVRWTEQRNLEAVLDMIAEGRLDVRSLISHRFPLAEATKAYELISGNEPSLGVLLDFSTLADRSVETLSRRTIAMGLSISKVASKGFSGAAPGIAFLGSGNYASSILIPAFKRAGARLVTVASSKGVSGVSAARKFGFDNATTDTDTPLKDPAVDAVVICTRHDTHAALVCRAITSGKDVFVEKPLAIDQSEIEDIRAAYAKATQGGVAPRLMVGFNRRFAPHIVRMQSLLASIKGPKSFVVTVNAGAVAAEHWTQDAATGGGRIIGEACHFVDLLRHLAGATIVHQYADIMDTPMRDTATLSLAFADGSIGAIHYLANGSKTFPKERIEVFAAGRILQLDNFRKLTGWGWPGFKSMGSWRQDKGQKGCAARFVEAVAEKGPSPIAFDELIEVARVTIALAGAVAR